MGRLKDLFTDRIWSIDTGKVSRVSKGYARLVTLIKLIRITINTFAENRMGFQCVALSYFVTLALIPLLAFTFAVTGGMGFSGYLDYLMDFFSSFVDSSMLDMVQDKAQNLIDIAKNGWVGVVAAFTFLWTILYTQDTPQDLQALRLLRPRAHPHPFPGGPVRYGYSLLR